MGKNCLNIFHCRLFPLLSYEHRHTGCSVRRRSYCCLRPRPKRSTSPNKLASNLHASRCNRLHAITTQSTKGLYISASIHTIKTTKPTHRLLTTKPFQPLDHTWNPTPHSPRPLATMRTITWVKMVAAGGICCIGGPALIYYVTPTEEELFLKYNPELQRRSLERRQEKQEEFDHFVSNLKKYSGTDRHSELFSLLLG